MFNTELPSPCINNRCRDRGKCVLKWSENNELTYECKCEHGFEGDNCEHGSTMTDVNTSHCVLVDPFIFSAHITG